MHQYVVYYAHWSVLSWRIFEQKSDPLLGVAKRAAGPSYISTDTENASRCKELLGNLIVTLNVNGIDGKRTILHAGDVFTICMFFYNSSRRTRRLEVSHGSNNVPKVERRIHTSESQQIIAMDNNIRVGYEHAFLHFPGLSLKIA